MWFLRFRPKSAPIFGLGITLLLLLAVACGVAATATPVAKPAAKPAAPVAAAPAAPAAEAKPAPLLAATPAPAPAATPAPAPTLAVAPKVHPGKVTWMVGSFGNERFDFALAAGGGHDYGRQLHGFLISSDVKDGRRVITPGIATDWSISSDGLTWNLSIRKGVKFHSGTEVTAEDVIWSLLHVMGPRAKEYVTTGTLQSLSRIVDKIEQSGPGEVSVTTKVPVPEFPFVISEATGIWLGVLPKREAVHDVNAAAAYDRNPIGAGILKLVRHVPAEVMAFERFADYYYQPKNGLPKDKRVNFSFLDLRVVPEEATRVAALRAGEADIAPVTLATRKQVEAGGGRLVFGPEGTYFSVVMMGCWKKQFPCRDKRVRHALQYAIDKELMRDRLYGGPVVMQVKGWYSVTPSTVGYSPDLDPFPFDPNKARQLLADAGYPGGKGFGKLIINTWKSASLPLMPESAQLGADFWKRELGLDVEVRVGEEADLKKRQDVTEELYGQILWRDNETRVDYSPRSTFGTPENIGRVHNDPELFTLVRQTLTIVDPDKRLEAVSKLYRRLREESYYIQLGYLNIPWGVGPSIRTWDPYPLAFYPSALHTITLK